MIIFVFDRVENIVGKGFFPRHVQRCHCVGFDKSLPHNPYFNSVPNKKNVNLFKFKEFTDNNFNVA